MISRRRISEQLKGNSRILQEMDHSDGGPLTATLHDLQQVFGERLQAFVRHGAPDANPVPSLALVLSWTPDLL